MGEFAVPVQGECIYRMERVIALRSDRRCVITIAEPMSVEEVALVGAALWEVWSGIKSQVFAADLACELHAYHCDELPIGLTNVVTLMEQDLRNNGKELVVLAIPEAATLPPVE
jgi:hypothetical protein